MTTISAMYHVKDEDEFLLRSLYSVAPFVDETIIFDTGSTDGTQGICRTLARNPKIHYTRFEDDFSTRSEKEFRELAIEQCRYDWILQLDGDCVLSNGWREAVEPFLNDPQYGYGMIRFFEHMGSYEYVHKDLAQKWMGVLFRKHFNLSFVGGINEKGTHGSLIPSAQPRLGFTCPDASWWHLGYTKRDIVAKLHRGIQRGDWGQDDAVKKDWLEKITEETLWRFMPPVELAGHKPEDVPDSMRDIYEKTYQLELDPNGRILKRINL